MKLLVDEGRCKRKNPKRPFLSPKTHLVRPLKVVLNPRNRSCTHTQGHVNVESIHQSFEYVGLKLVYSLCASCWSLISLVTLGF